ncbi:chromate reductase [Gammaproteobacteria bacterium]|nr:chromate reductase [Gammaproteobacteria bacterium]
MTLRIIAISGSLRAASPNTGLIRFAHENMPEGMELTIVNIANIPFYNADLKEKPAAVIAFLEELKTADGFLFATPEYNYSYAPALKNALDWASRETVSVLQGKAVALMGAAGGMGSSRAQYHLRQVLVYLDLRPLNRPEVFANAYAGTFDIDGNLTDSTIGNNVKALLIALKESILQLKK